ncbi:MAG: ribonuclease D [Mycobacteriaceae bacterium]|uniref:ribonuclease D n=1 Tax=Corynebacterium sp. TaxID=1720 RepID=UPI003F9B7E86
MAEHLTSPRGGVPPLSDSAQSVLQVADALADGHGAVAVDTERASGFRFDDRAYLVQLRRAGAGTYLIDPASVPESGELLAPVMNRTPWILHAAHTDLPALTSLGWRTPELHDTQIAGRLLGYGQIGLAGMLEEMLGVTVAKDKGREDWSARPIPDDLLSYAALDVEMLIELADSSLSRLSALGREGWYHQECERVLRDWTHPVSAPAWTALRGIGAIRDRRGLEVARRLSETRVSIARQRDIPPEQVLRSSAILALAKTPTRAERRIPEEIAASSRLAGARRASAAAGELRDALTGAVRQALTADPASLPEKLHAGAGHPDHRTWGRDYPVAHALLTGFREATQQVSESTGIRPEDLAVIRTIRGVAWEVAEVITGTGSVLREGSDDPVGDAEELLGGLLQERNARAWQIDLLVEAFLPVVAGQLH